MLLPRLLALGFLGFATTAGAATFDGLAVEVTNTSEPVLCAEKDNVAINFASPEVRHFQIEAVHPAYMGALKQDRWEPDWTACEDISEETSNKPHPTMSTLYEDGNVRIIGLSFTEFWRPSDVTVTIGTRWSSWTTTSSPFGSLKRSNASSGVADDDAGPDVRAARARTGEISIARDKPDSPPDVNDTSLGG